MTTAFDHAFAFLQKREGGYSNDPMDDGNWTSGKVNFGELKGSMMGISAASYPTLDIKNLTVEDCRRLYRSRWDICSCDSLPAPIAFAVFDASTNQGIHGAITMLQAALNVKVDGIIGPITIEKVHGRDAVALLAEFGARRMNEYGNAKNFPKYGLGWSRRLMLCMIAALEMIHVET